MSDNDNGFSFLRFLRTKSEAAIRKCCGVLLYGKAEDTAADALTGRLKKNSTLLYGLVGKRILHTAVDCCFSASASFKHTWGRNVLAASPNAK